MTAIGPKAKKALLTAGEREQLQVALAWAGVYEGGIDGAFGRGTRTAMALWQGRNGYEATGILTARERAAHGLWQQGSRARSRTVHS